ncbi:MAG TPA: ABC transporter permease [Nitrospira sp.]|nr:ABC transporter permease [Nitrospira sp.]
MSLFHSSLLRVCASLGWTHLSTHPGRTALTMFGVGLGVAATIAVQTANVEVLRSFEESVLTVAGPVTLEVSAGETGLDERLISTVRTVPGVLSARPVLEVGVRVTDGRSPRQSFSILGLDLLEELSPEGGRVVSPANPGEGPGERMPLENLLARNGLLIGHALASELSLAPRAQLALQSGDQHVSVSIIGVMGRRPGGPSPWDRIAVMDIAAVQRTFGLIGRLDRIDVVTTPTSSVEQVAEAIGRVLPPATTVRRPIQRSQQVESMVGAFQLNLSVLSMVGLLVGIFLIYNTVSFTVAQRRREVGILRAIGMSEPMVVAVFLAEAGVFGVVGGLLGGMLGLLLGDVLVALVGRTIHDLYTPLSHSTGTVGFPVGSGRLLVEAVLIGSGVSVLGALGPSVDAGRTIVVAALAPGEYDVAQRVRAASLGVAGGVLLLIALGCALAGPVGGVPIFGYVATFCLLAGLSCLVPILLQSLCRTRELTTLSQAPTLGGAIRHIAREQTSRGMGRNAVTVSAFLVGVAIMVGVLVMIRSFRDTVEIWIDQTVMADFIVAPAGWPHAVRSGSSSPVLPGAWRARLANAPLVSAVDMYRDLRIDLQGRPVSLVSRDLALHAARSRYLFVAGESAAILARAAAGEGAILSEVVANHLALGKGDRLSIVTPKGEQSLEVLGVFYDYATDGGKIVIDRSLYQQWWPDDGVTVFPVYVESGADMGKARMAILGTLAQASQGNLMPTVLSNAELRQEILRIFDRTFTLTYVLEAIAVIIATLGIINTLVTSVVERRRELATLQALGSSRGQVTALILWEAGYLGLLGTGMGLVGGGALALILIRVINRQSFGWTIQISWPVGLMAEVAALALVASLVAGFWPARWAARQPLVEGLRYE